jgi:hypothetical protein
MHRRDMETMLEIVLIHLYEILEYLGYHAVREMVDNCETYLMTKRQEENYLVDEEDVGCQKKPPCGALVTS